MKWIAYGPGAILVRFADEIGEVSFARCRSLVAHLEKNPPPGLLSFVPAFTTLLIEFDQRQVPDVPSIADGLVKELAKAAKAKPAVARLKEIPVVYDGPDLERVAETNRITVEQVIQIHSAAIYRVYMLGFAPGFPYLGDLDRRLHTPRLPNPRPIVPAGSVGIGGAHTGIYSVPSPGGWNIIGRTKEKIFDPERGRTADSDGAMFLVHQGDRIKFVPVVEGQAAKNGT